MSNKRRNMALYRLQQDYIRIVKDPIPYVVAHPLASNILEWHFAVKGPEETPYKGGLYHGKLVFPREFPFKPPSIYMITPNGRFKCNTRLCLSISDFHPDTWNPAWSVSTILTGLLSFMVEKNPTLGSIDTTDYEKRQFAVKSLEFNLKDAIFCELFPDLIAESKQIIKENEKRLASSKSFLFLKQNGNGQQHSQMQEHGHFIKNAVTNCLAILGFAAFVYTVHSIITSDAK